MDIRCVKEINTILKNDHAHNTNFDELNGAVGDFVLFDEEGNPQKVKDLIRSINEKDPKRWDVLQY